MLTEIQVKNRAVLAEMHGEFDSIDIFDSGLDHDMGNLVLQAARIMDMLKGDWVYLVTKQQAAFWEEVSNLHTLLIAVPLFFDRLIEIGEIEFRVLEMAVRWMTPAKNLCPEYAEWRNS